MGVFQPGDKRGSFWEAASWPENNWGFDCVHLQTYAQSRSACPWSQPSLVPSIQDTQYLNMGVQMFVWILALNSFAYIQVVELLKHTLILWNRYTVSHSASPFYIPISHAQEFQFLHILPTLVILPSFFWLNPHNKRILLYLYCSTQWLFLHNFLF